MKKNAQIVIAANPLDIRDVRSYATPPFVTVQHTLTAFSKAIPQGIPHIVYLNEQPLLRKEWPQALLQPKDTLTVTTLPQKEVAASALTIFAIVASGPIGAGLGASFFGSGSFGAGIFSSLFSASFVGMIGSAAWQSIAQKPQLGLEPQSPSYSLNSSHNRVRIGEAIPVLYGTHKITPDLIAPPYTRYENNGKQVLYQLFSIGLGDYELESAFIGDIPLGTEHKFKNTYLCNPNVTLPSAPGSWHVTLGDIRNFSLSRDNGWTEPIYIGKKQFLIDHIECDFVFPGGIFQSDALSNVSAHSIDISIEYKKQGSATWLPLPDNYQASGGALESNHATPLSKSGATLTFSGSTTNAVGFSIHWPVDAGQYEVRVKKHNASSLKKPSYVMWASLKGHLHMPPNAYKDIAVLPLRLEANSSTGSGANHRISLIMKRKIKTYQPQNGWSAPMVSNSIPFAIADMLMSPQYGAGLNEDEIDLTALYAIDTHLPEHYTFNAIFDQSITLWEALKRAARCAKTEPFIQGGKVRFQQDDFAHYPPPTTLFTPHNIIKNSFQISYRLDDFETPSTLSLEYINPDKNWISDTVTLEAAQHYQRPLHMRLQLFGCTNQEHAKDEAQNLLNKTLHRRRVVLFETELDGLLPVFGDTIAISHPLPSWGVSGVIEHYDKEKGTIEISEEVTTDGFLVVRYPDGTLSKIFEASRVSPRVIQLKEGEILATYSASKDKEPLYFAYGDAQKTWSHQARVISIKPKNRHRIAIEAVVLD